MKVLAIQPGAIGDMVLSLPALRWLRQALGQEGMEIWTERAAAPLVSHPAYAGRVRPLAETGFDSWPVAERALKELRAFEHVISWRGAGLPELVEAVTSVHSRACFLRQFPPAENPDPVHLADFRRAQLAGAFPAEWERASALYPPHPEIFFHEADHAEAAKFFSEDRGDVLLVALHAGASSQHKRWSTAAFAELALGLARRFRARILLSEGPLDREAVAEVETMLAAAGRGVPPVLARRLAVENLRLLAAVLRRCDLFVGNDSGITHLAAAAGVPVVSIFLASDPRVWGPRGRFVRVLEKPSPAEALAACENLFDAVWKGPHTYAR